MNEPIRAFVALPFEPAILEAFRRSLVPLLEECGISVRLPDATDHHRSVLKDIVTEIAAADVVVVDLTSSNPNVLYEAGVAHGLQKPVLCCTQDASRIPYDLQGYRAIVYPTGEWDAEARERIGNTVRAIAKRRTMLSGPVTDHVLRRIYEPAGSSFDRIAEFLNTELILYAPSKQRRSRGRRFSTGSATKHRLGTSPSSWNQSSPHASTAAGCSCGGFLQVERTGGSNRRSNSDCSVPGPRRAITTGSRCSR